MKRGIRGYQRLTAVDTDAIVALAQDGTERSLIAERFGLSCHQVKRILTAARRRGADVPRGAGAVPGEVRVRREEVAVRRAEVPADTRSLTARLFGDPLPGRSALDMEQRQEMRA